MLELIICFNILLFGIFMKRIFIISLLLNIEGIFIMSGILCISMMKFIWSLTSFMIIFISFGVLNATLGLTILIILNRFLNSSKINFLMIN